MHRGIRDCVHRWIVLTEGEMKLIDTPLFQRLRGVRQLTAAHFVYPDAMHTRFSHSIGTAFVATLYAKRIAAEYKEEYTKRWVTNVRLAALLHDIAHGPFSHAYDHNIYRYLYPHTDKGHDEHRKTLVKSDLLAPYIKACGSTPEEIIEIWNDKKVSGAIISGPLGADRIDFLLRDSKMCGMEEFGEVDYKRIIHNIKIVDGNLVYLDKLSSQIQNFLLGRVFMYENVYLHKTATAGDYVLIMLFEVIKDELNLLKRTSDPKMFCTLTDNQILEEAKLILEAQHWTSKWTGRKLPRAIEVSPEETNHVTRSLETLDKSKFRKYNIKIESGGEIVDAYDWLRTNGYVKNKVIKRAYRFEEK